MIAALRDNLLVPGLQDFYDALKAGLNADIDPNDRAVVEALTSWDRTLRRVLSISIGIHFKI